MMNSWKECKLGDVAEIKGGKRLPKGKLLVATKNEHPYIRITDFSGHKINLANIQYVDKETQKSIARYTVKDGDLIISIVGTIGLCAIVPNELDGANLTENCAKIAFDHKSVDSKFLYYQLISSEMQDVISTLNVGSTQPKLPLYNIQDIDILLPLIEEQKRIADILSSLDDKIDLLHRQNHTLETLAQTLFRQYFIEEADDDWKIGKLEDMLELNPTYTLKKDIFAPYLEMGNVQTNSSNVADWHNREFTSGTKFKNGDTVLARITPSLENGKTAYINFLKDNEIGWGSTEFIVMRTRKNYNPFISYLIAKNQEFRNFAIGNMTGTTGRQRAQARDLKKYEILLPSQSAINKLNISIREIPTKIKNNSIKIKTLENLRDTLLPKLLSGEMRVK